jgi:hypothetical protein
MFAIFAVTPVNIKNPSKLKSIALTAPLPEYTLYKKYINVQADAVNIITNIVQ